MILIDTYKIFPLLFSEFKNSILIWSYKWKTWQNQPKIYTAENAITVKVS